jgi:hypothetical protein
MSSVYAYHLVGRVTIAPLHAIGYVVQMNVRLLPANRCPGPLLLSCPRVSGWILCQSMPTCSSGRPPLQDRRPKNGQ